MDAECALPLFFLSKLTPRKPVCPPLNQRKVFLAKYLPLLFLSSPASHHLLSYAPLSNLHPQPPSWADYWRITTRPCMELYGRCSPPPMQLAFSTVTRNMAPWEPSTCKEIYLVYKMRTSPKWVSTNMSLFGRVHECKEHEHWSEK